MGMTISSQIGALLFALTGWSAAAGWRASNEFVLATLLLEVLLRGLLAVRVHRLPPRRGVQGRNGVGLAAPLAPGMENSRGLSPQEPIVGSNHSRI